MVFTRNFRVTQEMILNSKDQINSFTQTTQAEFNCNKFQFQLILHYSVYISGNGKMSLRFAEAFFLIAIL